MSRKKTDQKNTVTLVIPCRGKEPLLQRTIDHAAATAGCEVDIIVVDNGLEGIPPVGPRVQLVRPEICGTSAARHFGMRLAKTEVVVTIDAHVRIGRCWGLNILQTFASPAWHQTVACGHIGHLKDNFEPGDDPCYHGARINWMDTSAEPRAIVARWDPRSKAGQRIGAIMGAYYAMRRDWYDAMCQPWNLSRSWGCDEELISIASYLSGGDCRLLPDDCPAWHLFRASSPIAYAQHEFTEIINNRLRLLRLFPFSASEVAALCGFMGLQPPPAFNNDTLTTFADCYAEERARLEDYLKTWVTGYERWTDEARAAALPPPVPTCEQSPSKPQARDARPQQLAPIPVDVCVQCDARDSFDVTHTYDTFRRYKCRRCGKKAWRMRGAGTLNFSVKND